MRQARGGSASPLPESVAILCARVSWPVPAIRYGDLWRCSWCGARVKVVA